MTITKVISSSYLYWHIAYCNPDLPERTEIERPSRTPAFYPPLDESESALCLESSSPILPKTPPSPATQATALSPSPPILQYTGPTEPVEVVPKPILKYKKTPSIGLREAARMQAREKKQASQPPFIFSRCPPPLPSRPDALLYTPPKRMQCDAHEKRFAFKQHLKQVVTTTKFIKENIQAIIQPVGYCPPKSNALKPAKGGRKNKLMRSGR